ncbi:unnamed protein product, partial [Hapterophycus canaliculatus]
GPPITTTSKHDDEKDFDGTGLLVWPGSRALASFLASLSSMGMVWPPGLVDQPGSISPTGERRRTAASVRSSRTVLELGAGTGICGIVASLSLGCSIISTDRKKDVLDNLRENIRLNGLASKAKVVQLAWGDGALRKLPSEIREQSPFKVKKQPTI